MERKFSPERGVLSVSIVCPVGHEFEAADFFEELGLSLSSSFEETTRILKTQDGTILRSTGFEFTGYINTSMLASLIQGLSQRKIAGYSRETQIVSTYR